MKSRLDEVLDLAVTSNNNNQAYFKRLQIALDKVEPVNERIAVLEQFTIKNIPLITQMQISDAFQEFLCV
jgi:hypothetical protein